MQYDKAHIQHALVFYRAYPLLADCGGFDLLITKPKSRTELQVVRSGCCSTEELRCLGTGRIYLRPIQKSLIVNEQGDDTEEYEECIFCCELFLTREIRQHIASCTVSSIHVNSKTITYSYVVAREY